MKWLISKKRGLFVNLNNQDVVNFAQLLNLNEQEAVFSYIRALLVLQVSQFEHTRGVTRQTDTNPFKGRAPNCHAFDCRE
jgi:hypothetical protein